MHTLSKTDFVRGMGCPLHLWCTKNDPESLPPPSETDRAVMEQGSMIGLLAQDCYPGGIGVRGKTATACLLTRRLLDRGVPLYEATFQHERLVCKADILIPEGAGFRLVEVKSSGKVKDDHLLDIAFQVHVLKACGITVTSAHLRHINTRYVREGDLDLDALFTEEDVTERLDTILETIEHDIERLLTVIDGPRPPLDGHPHGCACDALVELPEHNVTELYRTSGNGYLEEGITCITDCPQGDLSAKQRIQQEAIRTNKPYVDKPKLAAWLDALTHPIVHLDFETINPAIPPYDGTSPYQPIPFQFSAHIEYPDRTEHKEFLGDGKADPREALCEALCRLPTSGCYLAHNATFERRIIRLLAKLFPERAQTLSAMEQTMHDSIEPFRNFWYYSPKQRGSCSIKAVLPALTGKGYDGLSIGDGQLAQVRYAQLATCSAEDAEAIRQGLLEYCELDTQGMVEILKVLREAVTRE